MTTANAGTSPATVPGDGAASERIAPVSPIPGTVSSFVMWRAYVRWERSSRLYTVESLREAMDRARAMPHARAVGER